MNGSSCQRFTRLQLTAFRINDNFQRRIVQIKLSDEATTRSKRKQMIVARRGRQHHHSVECFCAGGRGKFVVFSVGVVSEIGWLAQRAAGLRKHLETFAVKTRRCREREMEIKQHDLFDLYRLSSLIRHL